MYPLFIFYDNACPYCVRFSHWVKRLDVLHWIELRQLRNPQHLAEIEGIDEPLAQRQMATFVAGRWAYGYVSLWRIFLRLPAFWVGLPLLGLLYISSLGQYLYVQFALRRRILPLHCGETCDRKGNA